LLGVWVGDRQAGSLRDLLLSPAPALLNQTFYRLDGGIPSASIRPFNYQSQFRDASQAKNAKSELVNEGVGGFLPRTNKRIQVKRFPTWYRRSNGTDKW